MFCPNCGTNLPDDGKTKFCVNCGTPITIISPTREYDDFPKAPGIGRTCAVIICLLLIAGGAAGGILYFADHGLEMPQNTDLTTAPSVTVFSETNDAQAVTTTVALDSDESTSSEKTGSANGGGIVNRRFDFVTPNGLDTYVNVHFNRDAYELYHKKPRYFQPDEFIYYIDNPINDEVVSAMSEAMTKLADEQGYSHKELAYMAIRLVQSISYVNDKDSTGKEDYPKYPIETVYEMEGDCEDLSILLVALLRKMGFETCFVVFSDHVGVGIRLDDAENGTYFEYDGVKYYYVETTADGWNIGAYPEELSTDARLYFIKKKAKN